MAFGAGHNGLAGTGAPSARTPTGAARLRRAGHVTFAAVACVLAIGYSLAVGGGAPRGAAAAVAPPAVRQLHPNVSIVVGANYQLAADQDARCPASIAVTGLLLVTDKLVEMALSVGGSTCDGEPLVGVHHEGLPPLLDILLDLQVGPLLAIDPNFTAVRVESTRACGVVELAADTVIIFFSALPIPGAEEAWFFLPGKTLCELVLSGEPVATANALDD